MSIADKLTQLGNIRTDIRDALTGKGISASNHDYADFAQDIASIGGNESAEIQYDSNPLAINCGISSAPIKYTTRVSGGILTPYLTTSNGNYLSLNLHNYDTWRRCIKFKVTDSFPHEYSNLIAQGANNHFYFPTIWIRNNSTIGSDFSSNGTNFTSNLNVNYAVENDNWYYAVEGWNDGYHHLSLYDESGNKLASAAKPDDKAYSATVNYISLMAENESSNTAFLNGAVDIAESFFECDGVCVWGETNSKTANMGTYTFTFADFTQLDYLRSNGNQYLDLGYSVRNKDFSVTAKIRSTAGYNPIFSYNTGGGDGHYFQQGTTNLSSWINAAMRATVSNIDLTTFKEFTFSRTGTTYTNTCDGNSASYSYSISQTSNNVEVFRRYYNSSDIQWGSFDLKEFMLTTDSLVRHLVPVQHNEFSDLIGFFDKANGVLYVSKKNQFILPT